jgi:hypothetical protein
MANFVGLQDLVHAIAGAVTDAQQEVEKAQIANLGTYLDRDRRPLTLQLRVPSIRPEAALGDEDLYQAPLIALVAHSKLRIKQVEVSFDVELGDLAEAASAPNAPAGTPGAAIAPELIAAQVKRELNVNPAVSATVKQQGTTAHIVLIIEGVDPPEGVSRLVMDMTKTQGITGPVAVQTKT